MNQSIQKLLGERYYLEDEHTWDDLSERVSTIHPDIKSALKDKKFIPSSPTLMNANTGGRRKGTLSSCFTMGIEDSIDGIYDALKEGAIVTKASGGVGYVFSKLRSSKEMVGSLNRQSSGPIPFMRNFNSMLDGIQQGGVRRGAGMGQFDITHPDVLDVIRLKGSKGEMERLNISIRMTDEFYAQLRANPNVPHLVVDTKGEWFPLLDKGKPVTVGKLWDEIVEYAWLCAEPGIFNSDIATRQCTVTNIDPYVLSNPCSEYTNIAYSSCNLGSINLNNLVTVNGYFDWKEFDKVIRAATRFLNNVIDVNDFPLDKIRETTLKVRPIGLGVMGYAHMLYQMGIPFNSDRCNTFTDELFRTLTITSMTESVQIAKETGKSYPAFDYDLFVKANERFNLPQDLLNDIKKYGIANSCFTSIAPTGSISFLANTSGGIEPVFALTYSRLIEKLNREYEEVFITDPIFEEYLISNYDDKTRLKILKEVAENKGSCQEVQEIPEEIRKVFVVAGDLTPMEHLENLAIVARNTSLSVSKTVNLPSTATREQVSEVYLKAHELGVIGVTVYRDGCRDGILVHSKKDDKECIVKTNAPKRPKSLPCHVYKMNCFNRLTQQPEKWVVFVGLLEGDPYEILAGKVGNVDIPSSITEGEMVKTKLDGKKVYQFQHNGEVLVYDVQSAFLNEFREYVTRLMSLALRHGAGIEYLKDVLAKSNGSMVDFSKVIVRALNKYVKETKVKEKCPTCNADLIYSEGCIKCSAADCSYSKCAG